MTSFSRNFSSFFRYDRASEGCEIAVSLESVYKFFGSRVAVSNVSLSMYMVGSSLLTFMVDFLECSFNLVLIVGPNHSPLRS